MSVNLTGSIDYKQWQAIVNQQQGGYTTGVDNSSLFADNKVDALEITPENEKCTDGKDDGKIGFFSAVGNVLKGAGKTVVNAVKGCFTGKDGKFSLGKTLLTAATAAVCCVCPAVGVALGAVGAVKGAIDIGKGVVKASSATTDAEAKAAWQEVGGGGVTLGVSVAGAKASMGAMKNASTATNGLNSLEKGASLGTKAKAFMADAKSSTLNNGTKAGALAKQGYTSAKEFAGNAKNTLQEHGGIKGVAKSGVESAKNTLQEHGGVKGIAKNGVESIKNTINEKGGVKQIIKNGGSAVKDLAQSLPSKGKQILQDLTNSNKSYNQLVSEYGYENVIQVLESLAAIEVSV